MCLSSEKALANTSAGCREAVAGKLDIPIVFLSGDDKVVTEARTLMPCIVAVAIKEGLGIQAAVQQSHAES